MDLSPEDKERIIAEEKLRMETRKEFFNQRMHNGCAYRRGGRFLPTLAIILGLFALFHFLHRPHCGWGPGYYGSANYSAAQTTPPAPPPQTK